MNSEDLSKKDRVNCSIDPVLKKLFETSTSFHKKTFSELLEEAVIAELERIDPVVLINYKIEKRESELGQLYMDLAAAKALKGNYAEIKERALKSESEADEQEQERIAYVQRNESVLRYQIDHKTIDWKDQALKLGLKAPKDAEDFITSILGRTQSVERNAFTSVYGFKKDFQEELI
jgi:hypothetical protein